MHVYGAPKLRFMTIMLLITKSCSMKLAIILVMFTQEKMVTVTEIELAGWDLIRIGMKVLLHALMPPRAGTLAGITTDTHRLYQV